MKVHLRDAGVDEETQFERIDGVMIACGVRQRDVQTEKDNRNARKVECNIGGSLSLVLRWTYFTEDDADGLPRQALCQLYWTHVVTGIESYLQVTFDPHSATWCSYGSEEDVFTGEPLREFARRHRVPVAAFDLSRDRALRLMGHMARHFVRQQAAAKKRARTAA